MDNPNCNAGAALGPLKRAIHDEFGHRRDVAQFEQIAVYRKVPIEFIDFRLEPGKARLGAFPSPA